MTSSNQRNHIIFRFTVVNEWRSDCCLTQPASTNLLANVSCIPTRLLFVMIMHTRYPAKCNMIDGITTKRHFDSVWQSMVTSVPSRCICEWPYYSPSPIPYTTNHSVCVKEISHDDVIKWEHFPRYWPFVRGIHRSPANSPHKGHWRGALMFSLICAWINRSVNNREAGDLRHHRAHHDVIVMYHMYVMRCSV